MRYVALALVLVGCHHRGGNDECEEGAHRDTDVETCTCIRSHPHVAYPTPDSQIAARWSCTTYSDAKCRTAQVGSPCAPEGSTCQIEDDMCIGQRKCEEGVWVVGLRTCRP